MTAQVDYRAPTFTAALVTVTTEAGNLYRRLFLKSEKAQLYAEHARRIGGSALVESVTVTRRPAS